jgi:Cu-Zn family superoxide dismutase
MSAVAVFKLNAEEELLKSEGEVIFKQVGSDVEVRAYFTMLPPGEHGFHIHKAGDLRGEGCKAACDHFSIHPNAKHGGPPGSEGDESRHTGDLGNISLGPNGEPFTKLYILKNLDISELYGRSLIVHEDPDDLGKGPFEDSMTTGHSGKRIACVIIGRVSCPAQEGGDKGLYAGRANGRRPRVPGTGYGTRKKALHTIKLLKDKPIGLKRQIATTMYYRAKHHAQQTSNMREAMKVYRPYLKTLKHK